MTRPQTAFVFSGGGSLGAVQVGMLKALAAHGVEADLVVGSSVGAINGAYYAGRPDIDGIAALDRLWRSLRRDQIFPVSALSLARFAWRRDYLVSSEGLLGMITEHLPYARIEDARLPLHIVTTNFLSGATVVLSSGPAAPAVLASCSIPAAFAPVGIDRQFLSDGGIASNTPVKIAVDRGAKRLIVLPTGYACALLSPPQGAVASALHSLTLLTSGQLVRELEALGGAIEYHVVPTLCPLLVSPLDFSRTALLMDRAEAHAREWLEAGGLENQQIPASLRPHDHGP